MKTYLKSTLIYGIIISSLSIAQQSKSVWNPDNMDGTYRNPVIYADYSDPDVIRVGSDFYLVASSFSQFPGLPVLHSKELVNWEIIGHVVQDYPFDEFKLPQHGKGLWAPSLRYHDGFYWIFVGDPDHGILMSKAENPAGPWDPIHVVKEGKGLIDPCPFWDDDGKAYLVHAWAKSRAGFNSILTINRMNQDGKSFLDEGTTVFDGHENHPTIEGPKLYKRNGYYYIFAPAGGVKPGWQTVLRSKNILGPYKDKVVLEQGSTSINGPHQGGWIELESGESWFVHFQDRYTYGRVVLLNPVKWFNDWPEMGIDLDGNGIGEPAYVFNKPNAGMENPIIVPRTSDEFDSDVLGLQWQWEALPSDGWYSLTENSGSLRLFSQPINENVNLRDLPNVIGQKFPAEVFECTVKLQVNFQNSGDRSGMVILGMDYSSLELISTEDGIELRQVVCKDADNNGHEESVDSIDLEQNEVYLKTYVSEDAYCNFAYSLDGRNFKVFGKTFKASAGRWVGARIGLYSVYPGNSLQPGYTDIDWIRLK